ncbi:MAG: TonB-dependent receptor, partial [Archangium gephyra]
GNVHAQDSEASTPTTTETQATSGEVKELGSVTVTARKRSERQIDVPIAMTAVTGEQIDAFGISNIAEIISMTPGAGSVDNGGGFTQVQIRGVSSSLGGNDNGYYLDEIPFTGVSVPWYPEARSWDIDRVEILKGPQGTLFGEGSMGGTVRILTRKPDFNEFGGAIEASASTTQGGSDGWGGKAVVNIPLIDDRLAARVAVTDEKLSGWTDDNTTGNKDINEQRVKTGRVKVRFAPTDQWTMDLAYWTYKSEAPGGGNGALDDLTTNSFYSNDDEWRTASFVSTYDFGGSELFYSFADAELDYANDGMLNPTTTYVSNINLQVSTQELRWSSTGDRTLDWTVGYYLREAERNDASQVGTAAPSSSSQTNDAYAVFGEVTVKLPDPRWALTGGIRYFSDDVDAISVSTTRVSTLNATFDSWNPRVSLSFKPANDTTLYASAARGFR